MAYGVFGGFNVQNGNFVFGGEGRYLVFDGVDIGGAGAPRGEVENTFDLRARAGLAAGDALFYGALGYSWVGVDIFGDSGTLDGLNFGLGAEYNVTDSIFVGVDFTRRDVSGEVGGLDVEGDVDTATLRVGFRF
jgi:outer membrane immunogenic protein